jgi:hypothetical protein
VNFELLVGYCPSLKAFDLIFPYFLGMRIKENSKNIESNNRFVAIVPSFELVKSPKLMFRS